MQTRGEQDSVTVVGEGANLLRQSYRRVLKAKLSAVELEKHDSWEPQLVHIVDLAKGADCSKPFEREVAVKPQYSLSPHEEESRLPQLEDAVVDQPDGVPERTDDLSKENSYLRLSRRKVLRVLLRLLVVVEEKLDGRCVVGVLAREDDFDAEVD